MNYNKFIFYVVLIVCYSQLAISSQKDDRVDMILTSFDTDKTLYDDIINRLNLIGTHHMSIYDQNKLSSQMRVPLSHDAIRLLMKNSELILDLENLVTTNEDKISKHNKKSVLNFAKEVKLHYLKMMQN